MREFKNRTDLLEATRSFQEDFQNRWQTGGLEKMLYDLDDLQVEIQQPDFWDNPERAQNISQKKASREKLLRPWQKLKKELEEFPELIDLSCEEVKDENIVIEDLEKDFQNMRNEYEHLLMTEALMGPDDGHNVIMNITPGAGGTESQDWSEILLRMYLRWCEKKGFQISTLDLQNGDEAGIKSASLLLSGENAYGRLKSESGIHRLVRLSPFDANKRRHTSFASVHVVPEIDENINIEIDEKDLRIDTYRASGAGGQHVNKTDSAIRITHISSDIVVQCQNERSQHKNKATAMKILKARLYEKEKEKIEEDIKNRSSEKKIVGWGSQIRSYVMHPYKMVKDLRTGHETSNVDQVLDGDIDPFIESYLKELVKQK